VSDFTSRAIRRLASVPPKVPSRVASTIAAARMAKDLKSAARWLWRGISSTTDHADRSTVTRSDGRRHVPQGVESIRRAPGDVGPGTIDQRQGPAVGQHHPVEVLLQLRRLDRGDHQVGCPCHRAGRATTMAISGRLATGPKTRSPTCGWPGLEAPAVRHSRPFDSGSLGREAPNGTRVLKSICRLVSAKMTWVPKHSGSPALGIKVRPAARIVGQRRVGQHAQCVDARIQILVDRGGMVLCEVGTLAQMFFLLLLQVVPGQPDGEQQQRCHAQPDQPGEEIRKRPRLHGSRPLASAAKPWKQT
jgi:hypothetical protein